jgi:hypothetical protein
LIALARFATLVASLLFAVLQNLLDRLTIIRAIRCDARLWRLLSAGS